jgi:hypothetical protein
MRLWLIGGADAVHMFLLFNWSILSGFRIKGVIEVYNLDQAGNENLIRAEVVTSMSIVVRSEHMKLMADKSSTFSDTNHGRYGCSSGDCHFRGQLFGLTIPVGRNPNDTFDLSLDKLSSYEF